MLHVLLASKSSKQCAGSGARTLIRPPRVPGGERERARARVRVCHAGHVRVYLCHHRVRVCTERIQSMGSEDHLFVGILLVKATPAVRANGAHAPRDCVLLVCQVEAPFDDGFHVERHLLRLFRVGIDDEEEPVARLGLLVGHEPAEGHHAVDFRLIQAR